MLMADSDNLLTYVRMALYDGKLKEYAKDYMQSLTPVGTVLKLASKVHPYYLYGGSWESLSADFYTLDTSKYLGAEATGLSVRWRGTTGSDTLTYTNYTNTDKEFYNISALTGWNGLTAPTSDAPTVGDFVRMSPVPMAGAIPIHRHTQGYTFTSGNASSASIFRSTSAGYNSNWAYDNDKVKFENNASYGSSDVKYNNYVEAGWLDLKPAYLNCIFWHKLSNETGADGAQSTDGFEKPDNALFT